MTTPLFISPRIKKIAEILAKEARLKANLAEEDLADLFNEILFDELLRILDISIRGLF